MPIEQAQAQKAVEAARAAGGERLVVGFYGSAASALLTDVLRIFGERLPSVEVVLRELELSHIDDVGNGRVDVAFTRLRPGEADLEVEVLLGQRRRVVLPAAHPLADRDSIVLAELRDESFITGSEAHNPGWRAQWLTEQRQHGLPGRIAAEASSVQEILTLVATGRGVAWFRRRPRRCIRAPTSPTSRSAMPNPRSSRSPGRPTRAGRR